MRQRSTDIRVIGIGLYFLPVQTRMPLKFGTETLTSVTCARVRVQVEDRRGGRAEGWGETPLSVQWVWPSKRSHADRYRALREFCRKLAAACLRWDGWGHPIELGHDFQQSILRAQWEQEAARGGTEDGGIPWLAALLAHSPFDLALHDAYGKLHNHPIYALYDANWMNRDLAGYLEPAPGVDVSFQGRYPSDFLRPSRQDRLTAWHLVGGLDPLEPEDQSGPTLEDGYPVTLRDWIRRDGLKCLKVKLTGTQPEWDFERLVRVGGIAASRGVDWLSADFNCTVAEVAYVNVILDRLRDAHPRIYGMLLYVEQPFPYELEQNRMDVHSLSARKPLFLDESAHDWKLLRLGRELGWNGVALKTCKTQSGALLSACWAQAHGMALMVQDLTNPMLAQIPHLLLAAHVPTVMGVETNSMQFYPDASAPEMAVHPGLYRRFGGKVDLTSLNGPGFGYRLAEIKRTLPEPVFEAER